MPKSSISSTTSQTITSPSASARSPEPQTHPAEFHTYHLRDDRIFHPAHISAGNALEFLRIIWVFDNLLLVRDIVILGCCIIKLSFRFTIALFILLC